MAFLLSEVSSWKPELFFPMDDGAVGLMGGQHKDLGNLYMLGGAGSIKGDVSNIVTSEWLDTTVDIVSTLGITMETHIGEVCLHQSRLDIRHT